MNKTYQIDNYWEGNNPKSQMLHISGGTSLIGAYETLKARGLSYNYAIHFGEIYELVHWSKCAWHAGVIHNPNLRARAFYNTLKDDENPNRNSVGIVFIQPFGTTSVSEEDVDAYVRLTKWLGQETGVRYNADNIFYHHEVTDYKPKEVGKIREQVLDGLVGDKDDKDAGEMTRLKLIIKLLQLRLKLLLLKK